MKASDVPTKFQLPFGDSAPSGNIRAIPVTTTDPNAASQTLGFPTNTLTPISAGGSPPDGRDMNGLLNEATAWDRWFSAGAPIKYDAAFAALWGGYPKGATVQSATTFGVLWYCTSDDNLTDPDAGGAGWTAYQLGVEPAGGCQLRFNSTSQLLLAPMLGGKLWINGLNCQVPAGLVMSSSGLASGQLYYVYARQLDGQVAAVEASATGYTLNAQTGFPQKADDPTKTCVGMCILSLGAFVQSVVNVGVISYFNRRDLPLSGIVTASAPTTVIGALAELTPTCRVFFLSWADEMPKLNLQGTLYNENPPNTAQSGIIWDISNSTNQNVGTSYSAPSISTPSFPGSVSAAIKVADGYHYATPAAGVGSGGRAICNLGINGSVRG